MFALWIHHIGLPLSICEDEEFQKIICRVGIRVPNQEKFRTHVFQKS
jgi:hypothetical protein